MQVSTKINVSRLSTASLGKFTEKLVSVVGGSNDRVVRETSLFWCINDERFAKMVTLTVSLVLINYLRTFCIWTFLYKIISLLFSRYVYEINLLWLDTSSYCRCKYYLALFGFVCRADHFFNQRVILWDWHEDTGVLQDQVQILLSRNIYALQNCLKMNRKLKITICLNAKTYKM